MRSNRPGVELALAMIGLGLLALALAAPAMTQAARSHDFADQRTLWDIPFAADVLSSVAFAIAGLAGLVVLFRLPPRAVTNMQRAMAALFFVGLVLTALGSAWYHAHPDDAGLAVDRSATAVASAGLLALAIAVHVTERAAAVAGLALLLLGRVAVDTWVASGNVLPWTVLQTGGMAVLVWLALLRPRAAAPQIDWAFAILAYVAAKLLECADQDVYASTAGIVSGHMLGHLAAASGAWPVIVGLAALRHRRAALARERAQAPARACSHHF